MENELIQKNKDREDTVRFGLTIDDLRQAFEDQLLCMQGRLLTLKITRNDAFRKPRGVRPKQLTWNQGCGTKGVRPLSLTLWAKRQG